MVRAESRLRAVQRGERGNLVKGDAYLTNAFAYKGELSRDKVEACFLLRANQTSATKREG